MKTKKDIGKSKKDKQKRGGGNRQRTNKDKKTKKSKERQKRHKRQEITRKTKNKASHRKT
jgi:hypothetical protein